MDPTNNNNNNNDDGTDQETILPALKKLRSSEPDVKVILVYKTTTAAANDETNNNNNNNNNNNESNESSSSTTTTEHKREYSMYSVELCRWSKFADACLSAEMRESTTKEIVFQDVNPETFDLAVKLVADPMATRGMTVIDAVKVVEFYDKYEFTIGLALCDDVLAIYFDKMNHMEPIETSPQDLDFLIDAFIVSERFALAKSLDIGGEYLYDKLFKYGEYRFNASMFSIEQVKKLHHLFKQGYFPDAIPEGTTQEELESACFPKFFVGHYSNMFSGSLLKSISLEGTESGADGNYEKNTEENSYRTRAPVNVDGNNAFFYIEKHKDLNYDWAITVGTSDEYQCWWRCPHSSTLEIPPSHPWQPVHPRAGTATPTLEYKFHKKVCDFV